MSSRGSGEVHPTTGIVEGFVMETIDVVGIPSVSSAIPRSVMESLDLYQRGYEVENLAEAVIHDVKAQEYFNKEIKKFLTEMWN